MTGVYIIENMMTGRKYVGSSSTDLDRRLYLHRWMLIKGVHENCKLQNSWNKWGEDAFDFYVVEEAFPGDCIAREQAWIDGVKPSYNISLIAGSRLGVEQTAETCAKISSALLGNQHLKGYVPTSETRKKISVKLKGRVFSAETREKIRVAKTGVIVSYETRTKLSIIHKKRVADGFVLSPEARAKISVFHMGNQYTKGYKHTSESRARMRAGQLLRWSRRRLSSTPSEILCQT